MSTAHGWFTHILPHASLSPTEAMPQRHLLRFSCFCTAHGRQSLYFTVGLPFPLQNPIHIRDLDSHLTHGSLGPPESTYHTTSRSVQWFLQGSQLWQTDRQTDHATTSVTVDCIYVCSTSVWPNTSNNNEIGLQFLKASKLVYHYFLNEIMSCYLLILFHYTNFAFCTFSEAYWRTVTWTLLVPSKRLLWSPYVRQGDHHVGHSSYTTETNVYYTHADNGSDCDSLLLFDDVTDLPAAGPILASGGVYTISHWL